MMEDDNFCGQIRITGIKQIKEKLKERAARAWRIRPCNPLTLQSSEKAFGVGGTDVPGEPNGSFGEDTGHVTCYRENAIVTIPKMVAVAHCHVTTRISLLLSGIETGQNFENESPLSVPVASRRR